VSSSPPDKKACDHDIPKPIGSVAAVAGKLLFEIEQEITTKSLHKSHECQRMDHGVGARTAGYMARPNLTNVEQPFLPSNHRTAAARSSASGLLYF
jgi:hypothetical protein